MARLNLKDYKKFINREILKIKVGQKIDFFTFKKDRKISILKMDNERYKVTESGFRQRKYEEMDRYELEKVMEKLKKIEFPKSNTLFIEITEIK